MKNIKELFLALIPTAILSLISCAFIYKEGVNWTGIICIIILITLMQMLLWFRNPKRVLEPASGWMVSGSAYILSEVTNVTQGEAAILKMMAVGVTVMLLILIATETLKKRET